MVEGAGFFAPGLIKGRRKMELRLLGGRVVVFFGALFVSATWTQYIDNLSSRFIRPMVKSAFTLSAPISMIRWLVIIRSPIDKKFPRRPLGHEYIKICERGNEYQNLGLTTRLDIRFISVWSIVCLS